MFNFGDFHSTGQAQDSWAFWEIPLFVLQGCIGGMAGALFIAVNKRLTTFRLAHVNISKVRRLLDVAFVQTLVSVCAFIVPLTLGNCINKPDPNSTDPNQVNDAAFSEYLISFYCPSTQYNDIASFWFTPTEGAIRLFYHLSSGDNFALVHLVMFFVIYTSLMCLGGGTSIPAGLFIPTLLSGSALGRLVGEVANRVLPNGMAVDAGTYALIGSASMLGGTTRMSISIAVILLEATGNYSYGLPIMVTLMTARLVGNIFNHGLYDMQIELRKWPMLEDRVKKTVANELRVCDVMTKEVRVFQEVEAVGRIADTLQTTEHSGFPVVFSETMLASHPRLGNLAGYIQRKHLAVLLAHRAFHADLPQQRFDRMAHDDDAHKAHAPTETSPYPMIFTAARPSQQAGTLAAAAGGAGGPQHGGPSRLSTLQAGPLDPGASTIAVAAQSAGPASSSATDTTVRGPDSLFVLSAGGEGGGAAAAVAAASQGVGPGSAPSSLPASSSGSTSAPSQRAAALHAVSLSLLDSSLASGISNPASPTGLLTSPPAQAGPGRQGSGHGQGAASSGLPPLAPGSSLSIRTAGAPGSSLPPSVAGTPATASVGSSGRSAGFVDAGADADDSISNRRALLAARTGRAQSQVRLIRVPLTLPAAAAPGGAGGSSGSGSSLPHGMLSRAASLVVGGSGGVGSHMLSHEHAHAGSGGSSLNAAGHHSSSYGGYSALGSGDVGSIASASLAGDGDSSAMFSPAAPAYLTPQDSASHPAYYGGVGSARATGGYTSLMGHPQSAFPGTGGSNRELIAGPSGPGGLRLRSSAQEQLAAGRSSSFAAHGVGFGSLYRTTAGAASGVRQYAAGGTGAYGELPGGFAGDSSAAAGENSGSAEATEAPHSAALYNALYDGEARYADEPLLLWRDFEAAYPRYPDARSLSFTADEKRMYVDLRPYMDPTPLTVHVHTPLQRAYHLFKDMGLRHLLVVNNSHDVVGVVSRNNLTHEWLHECYHAVVEASHERERLRIEAAEAAAGGDGAGRAGGGVWSNLWSSVVGSGGRRQHGKRRGGDGVEPLLAGEEPGSPTSASSSAASTALHRGEIMMSPPRAASVLSPEAVAALHHVRQQSLQGRRGPGMASGDLEAAAAEAAAGSGSAPHAATTPVRPARRAGGQLAGVKYVQFDDHATVDGI
jgi:CBS domain-containing protein